MFFVSFKYKFEKSDYVKIVEFAFKTSSTDNLSLFSKKLFSCLIIRLNKKVKPYD